MNSEERTTLAMILAVVLTFGIGYFGLRPALADYHQKRVAVGARGLEIVNLNERKTALVQLETQLKKYASQIELLNLAVPAEPQYPELLAQLTALTDETALILTSVQPQQSDLANATAVPVNLTVRGSFPNMLSLAEKIEKNLRPVTVSSISLIDSGDPGTTNQLTATIQLRFVRTATIISSGGTP